jgi:transposase InsO family protein
VLVHKQGKENNIADPLSRPSRFQVTDAEDNRDQLVLNPERFVTLAAFTFAKPPALEQKIRDCSDCEVEVAQALEVLRKKGPHRLVNNLLKWKELDGLLYYKGKLYIPNNKELHAEIIKTCHDTPTTGHSGKHETLELVLCHYWWPKMGASVEQYVLGCDKCQRYKPAQHPNSMLQPHETPTAPWEHVSVDLITQLPGSNGFDSICVYVDHYLDQCHLVPCKSNLTAEDAADIHYSDVFCLHGIPKKIFSDRGLQFAARFMRALYKRLGIETGFTTAYHPQGNGKVERKNQEVEQYLCLFCNKRQDDWASHLPAAEFALNSRLHSGASQTPFEIVYGYWPDFTVPIRKRSNMPSLDERLDRLANVWKEAEAALQLSKERMKEQFERNKRLAHVFNIGDMVWLTAKDIKIHQKTPKLGPRQLGPYKVLEWIGDLDYRLELPLYLNLNPVVPCQPPQSLARQRSSQTSPA